MPREACQRRNDDARGRRPLESSSRTSCDDYRLETLEAKLQVAVRSIQRPREAVDLERERRLVDARGRRGLSAEDPDADAAEAAHRAESVALPPRKLDHRAPPCCSAPRASGR